MFSAHIFPSWGWRIPFLLSLPMAVVTLYFRSKLHETPDFEDSKKGAIKVKTLVGLLKHNWKSILMVILLAGGFGVTYQVAIIFMKQYLPIVLPQTISVISTFSVLFVLAFGLSMPIAGFFADMIGVTMVILYSLLLTILFAFGLIIGIKYQMVNLVLGSCICLACSVAPFNGLSHGIMIKVFSVNERYRSIGLGHTIGSMMMSGTANYICLSSIKLLGWELFPVIYLMIFAIISYMITYFLSKRV